MGQRLVETKLASELGISRAPVREALRRLLEERLIVERPHHGMMVRTFEGDEIIDVYNVRLALEVAALRLFVRRGSSTKPLWARIEERRVAARNGDVPGAVAADFAFHKEVFEGSGSQILKEAFAPLAAQTLMVLVVDAKRTGEVDAEALAERAEEHVPVVEAIESGVEERAIEEFVTAIGATVRRVAEPVGGDPSKFLGRSG